MRNNVHFFKPLFSLIIGVFFLPLASEAQVLTLVDSIAWTSPQEIQISKYDVSKKIHFEGAHYSYENVQLPFLLRLKRIKNGNDVKSIQLGKTVFSPLTAEEKSLLKDNSLIGKDVSVSFGTAYDRGEAYAEYKIYPFRSNGGNIEKLISYEIIIETARANSVGRAKSTTTESVLSSGQWIKIGVTSSGVFKLTRDVLASYGLNVAGNPRNIKLYGNGGAMLPERNNVYYPDDLAENAIHFEGENDGSFDASDYILFYAQGPVDWTYDNVKGIFQPQKNIYCDTTWYFITASNSPG